jgi:hypothetical protein
LLPERIGMQSQVIESAERTTEDVATRRHGALPHARIDAESGQDRGCRAGTHTHWTPVLARCA